LVGSHSWALVWAPQFSYKPVLPLHPHLPEPGCSTVSTWRVEKILITCKGLTSRRELVHLRLFTHPHREGIWTKHMYIHSETLVRKIAATLITS
jgi:hypothetical protein